MANIGIMGGTFDPIHIAHLIIADAALEECGLDKIVFMTGGNPPHKREIFVTPAEIRHRMVLAAIKGNSRFEASDLEIVKGGYSYTSQTLKYLTKTYPENQYFFIIGEDSLAYLDEWYEPEVITALSTIVVCQRGDTDVVAEAQRIKNLFNAKLIIIDVSRIDISSTKIREYISNGRSVRYMLPLGTLEIIEREHLYLQEGRNDGAGDG